MHFTVFDGIVFACFLVSLSVFFQKPVPRYLKLFPVYLFCALILGMIAEWLSYHNEYSTGLINVWSIFEFCFFFYVLHEIILSKKVKRMILFIISLFVLFAFVNIIFIQKKVGFNPVNFTVGCLIVVSLCIYYFVELFQKTETESLARLPAFWIASGLLFNNVLSFPVSALDNFMEKLTRENYKAYHIIFDNIGLITNIIILLTSILYSIGFLCRIRIRKSTL
jgi:hypothetical protein